MLSIGIAIGWLLKPSREALPDALSDAFESRPPSVLGTVKPSSDGIPAGAFVDVDLTSSPIESVDELVDLFGPGYSLAGQAAAYGRLCDLSVAQLEALAKALTKAPIDFRSQMARSALFSRWAEVDPEAVLQFASGARDRSVRQEGIVAAIRSIAQRDLSRARHLIGTLDDGAVRGEAIRALIMQGAAEDPVGMLDLLAAEGQERGVSGYHPLFEAWAREDPTAAAKRLASVPKGHARAQAIQGLMIGWAQKDAGRALNWAATLENGNQRREALRLAIQSAAGADFDRGLALLSELSLSPADEAAVVKALGETAFRADLEGALRWVEFLPVEQRTNVLASHFHEITEADPERAKALLMANLNGRLRPSTRNVAEALARDDLESARAWAEELPPGPVRRDIERGIVNALSSTEPGSAAAYLENEGMSEHHRQMAGNVVSRWFAQDREGVMDWIEGQEDPSTRLQLQRNVVKAWAAEAPPEASAYALGIEDQDGRRGALKDVLNHWIVNDPAATTEFVRGLEAAERTAVMPGFIDDLARHDVNAAVEVFEEHFPEIEDGARPQRMAYSAAGIVERWVDWDPQGAADWAASLENNAFVQSAAVRNVARVWAHHDPMGASEWIGQLPAGAARDGAVTSLVERIDADDPASALVWANSMTDENQRQAMVVRVISTWRRIDRGAAFNALQSANLSEETFQTLSQQFDH